MKNRNLKFLLLGMTILSLSTQTFSQEYKEGSNASKNVSVSTKDQIASLEKRNTELSKERQDQYKLLRGKQNFAQSYRHRLTYETGAEKEKTQKKQDAILAEIRAIHAKRSEILTLIHKNEDLIESLKKAPTQPVEIPLVADKAIEEVQPEPVQPTIIPAEKPPIIDKVVEEEVIGEVQPKPSEREDYKLLIRNNTPYTHSLKTGIESIQLFENNVVLKDKTAENQWNAKGNTLSSHSKNDAKISSNINGAIGTVEYGLSENSSLAFSLGGNHQNSSFKGDNSLKGTSMYLGGYYEYTVKNLRTVTGLGYQLTDLKSERDKNTEKYKQNTYNVFTEVSYMANFSETFHIEPIMRLSYYNLSQDKAKENYTNDSINMSVNKTTKKIGNLFVGSNFIKNSYFNSGKLSSIFTVGVNKTLGDRSLNATGNILGKDKVGSDFKLENEKFSRINGVTGLTLEFQNHNNITYSTGANFLFGDNSNRALQFNVGISYKF